VTKTLIIFGSEKAKQKWLFSKSNYIQVRYNPSSTTVELPEARIYLIVVENDSHRQRLVGLEYSEVYWDKIESNAQKLAVEEAIGNVRYM
jgi:hypothetical protein